MPFPSDFGAKAQVLAPSLRARDVKVVLERLESALYKQDAEIVERGEDFIEFRVPVGERLLRDFSLFGHRWHWPLTFVSSGTVSVTEDLGVYRVVADLRTSFYPILQLLPVVLAFFVVPVEGAWARLLSGLVAGLAFNAATYAVGKWQFRGWLERMGWEITDDLSRGRLTSA